MAIDEAGQSLDDSGSDDDTAEVESEETETTTPDGDPGVAGEAADADAGGTEDGEEEDGWGQAARDKLAYQATQLGLTDDEIDQYGSFEELAIGLLERQSQAAPSERAQEQQQEQPEGFSLDLPELDPDEYPEEFRNVIGSIKEQVESHLNHLGSQLQGSQAYLDEQQAIQYDAQFDQAIEALGNEGLFGKGSIREMDGKAAENRMALDQKVGILKAGYHAAGVQEPPLNELIAEAYRARFGDAIETDIKRGLSQQLRTRQSQVSPKVRAQRAPKLKGEEAAKARFNEIADEIGLPLD